LEEVATTLSRSGDGYEIVELDVREGGLLLGKTALFVNVFDDGYYLLDPYEDMFVSQDSVLRVLSEDARAWSLFWVGPRIGLAYMEDQELLVKLNNVRDRGGVYGSMPHLLDDELDAIWDICERDGRTPGVAEMLAVVELASGVRLSGEFVQDTSTALIIDDPIG